MKRSVLLALVAITTAGCGSAVDQTQSEIAASATTVFESVIEVHWSNGMQTHHQLFGPIPKDGLSFNATQEFEPLRAATASSKSFYFEHPTAYANKAVWRLVWAPGNSEARLVAISLLNNDEDEYDNRTNRDISFIHPREKDHPVNDPRVQTKDITAAFNQLIAEGRRAQFRWDTRVAR